MIIRSFSGGALDAIKDMRIAYVDEGGVSKEPYVVVAGIVPDPNLHHFYIVEELEALRKRLPAHRKRAIFHAMDIYHGSGEFPREEWPNLEDRLTLLDDLVSIPGKLGIDVVYAYTEKEAARAAYAEWNGKESLSVFAHIITGGSCVLQIEAFLRCLGDGEVAHMVAENNQAARTRISAIHNFLSEQDIVLPEELRHTHSKLLPLKRVIDTPLWAEKRESAPLQIADACAWTIRRALQESKHYERAFEILCPSLVKFEAPEWEPIRIFHPADGERA